MFEELIVNTIDKNKSTHPSFVEIIKQLDGEEAMILKAVLVQDNLPLSEIRLITTKEGSFQVIYRNLICLYYQEKKEYYLNDKLSSFIDNWIRLGLITVSLDEHLSDEKAYDSFKKHPHFLKIQSQYSNLVQPQKLDIHKGVLTVTDFGKHFAKAISLR